ncbi:MAG: arylsulfatase [Phycisphaeraceae bacterium]
MLTDDCPNILLIMTDQQRGDALGADGHPVLQTPNLDGLANAGSRFARAYSTCPSCVPARRALLCGQHPATNGMVGMRTGVDWHPDHTLPGELTRAGYQTHLVGRHMHQHPMRKRFGYESVNLGSTHLYGDDYAHYIERQTPELDGFRSHGLSFNGWTARPWSRPEHEHPVNWTVNEALRFLAMRDPTCPFFLTVSFYAPHPPLCPPPFFMERYLRQDMPEPTIGDWCAAPNHPAADVDAARDVVLTGERLRTAQAGYFGSIDHVDNQIYRLLSVRGEAGYDVRNTVVIFISDHGEMLGDHYMFRKCEPYEGSARVPMIIAGGADTGLKGGQVLDGPVCLEDVMPTCLELAGVEIPEGVDGKSLVGALRGEGGRVREVLHGEHATQYSREQANHYLTDGRWKYIWRPLTGEEQLFDLEADPHESVDLAAGAEAEARVQPWRERLVERLRDRPEGFVEGGRLRVVEECPKVLPHGRG